ncbi:MAG: hypothetical protein ACYDCC_10240 [Actinomycetota bacterium]
MSFDSDLKEAFHRNLSGPPEQQLRWSEIETRIDSTHRSRVIASAALCIVAIVGAIIFVPRVRAHHNNEVLTGGPAIEVTSRSSIKQFVHNAMITQSLSFDHGGLRLDPPQHRAKISELDGMKYWQSAGSFGYTIVGDVIVFRADVTLGIPVSPDGVGFPSRLPHFKHRGAWVITWINSGGGSCPAIPVGNEPSAAPVPQSIQFEIIADDGSAEGVTYATSGADPGCFSGTSHEPRAAAAMYGLSLTWTASPKGVIVEIPPCGQMSGSGTTSDRTGSTMEIDGSVVMVQPCGPPQVSMQTGLNGNARHAPTGFKQSKFTSQGRLDYYDGEEHSIAAD